MIALTWSELLSFPGGNADREDIFPEIPDYY